VRVPPDPVVHPGRRRQRDLDERNPALDQPAREQAPLPEEVAAVLVAEGVLLFGQVERLDRRRAHQGVGPAVRGAVAVARGAVAVGQEVGVECIAEVGAGHAPSVRHAVGQVEVLHLQQPGDVLSAGRVRFVDRALGDDERRVARAEEAGAVRLGAEEPERGDADEARQLGVRAVEFLADERPDGRVADRPAGDAAGAHQVAAAAVVGLLGGHPAKDRELVGAVGELRQVLADLQIGHLGLDGLDRAAVGVVGLRVPGVDLAGAAVHP
jgi:hypothetical protein